MNESHVTLRPQTVKALMAASFVGAGVGAGLLSGLLMRGGVQAGYAHGSGLLFAALLMYPCLRALTELRNGTPVSFHRWTVAWIVTAVGSAAIVYPVVVRLLDRLM